MHATELAHIAANFASIGYALLSGSEPVLSDSAHGYWLANRFRCDAWHQRISRHRSAIERCGTSQRSRLWHDILPTLQEILISEPLTRAVAYVTSHLEKDDSGSDWGALADSVLVNHVEARHRCLNLMVFGYGLPVEGAVGLNHLRRMIEFYSDQLLGALPPHRDLESYAFEPGLVAAAQRDYRRYSVAGPLPQVRLLSLATAIQQLLASEQLPPSPNSRLNESIAEAALAMLPPDLFDSFGVVRGRVQTALAAAVDESPIASSDFERPLAAPFDLLAHHLRQPGAKTSRRF